MGKINAGRVLLGGLLAGVVINISEWFWNGVVFAKDMQEAMAKLNKTMDMGGSTMAIFIAWGFLIGILAVYLYAAIRPRFGAGRGTAIRAGLMMWLLVYVSMTISMAPMGLFPVNLMLLGLPISLVEIVVATWLGAWLYKE
jgi:magnesium-transporting ATPase (P-type)